MMQPYFNKVEHTNWKIIKYIGANNLDEDYEGDYYYLSRIKDYERYYLHNDRKIRFDIKNHETGLFRGIESVREVLEDFYKVTGEERV
jgi:hypothetical protein